MRLYLISFLLVFLISTINSQEDRFVLIIGVDGVRPDALEFANTPNFDALAENGIFSPNAINQDATISGPGWSAIICGVRSEKHLVSNNDFSNNNYEEYPSIFRRIKEVEPEHQLVSFCHWTPINDFIIGNDADFKLNFNSDEELANTAVDYLRVNDPKVTFIHFDEVDGAGHGFGFSANVTEYVSAIERTDEYIGILLEALEERPNYLNEDWLIISTTDHGGVGFGHGGTTLPHREVYMIASGKNIEHKVVSTDTIYIIEENNHCLGDSISLDFQNNNARMQAQSLLFNFGADKDFTIECRVKTTVTADVSIIGNKDWNSGSNPGFVFSFKYPSGPEWKMNIGDGNNRVDINQGGLIADGEWHMLTISFDRDGMAKMYEDGAFLTEASIADIGNIDTDGGIYIGSDINQAYDYEGMISEVRIWDGVISADTIQALHCSSIEETHPMYDQLLAYWRLNKETSEVHDLSSNDIGASLTETLWDTSNTTLQISYVNTPRLVDVPTTVLSHLCIDNDPIWELEGKSLITEDCLTITNDIENIEIAVYPNPTLGLIFIEPSKPINYNIQVYDNFGCSLIQEKANGFTQVDLSYFNSSINYLVITNEAGDLIYQTRLSLIK